MSNVIAEVFFIFGKRGKRDGGRSEAGVQSVGREQEAPGRADGMALQLDRGR